MAKKSPVLKSFDSLIKSAAEKKGVYPKDLTQQERREALHAAVAEAEKRAK